MINDPHLFLAENVYESYRPVNGVVSVQPPRAYASSSASQSVIVWYSAASDLIGKNISTPVCFSCNTESFLQLGGALRQQSHPLDGFLWGVLVGDGVATRSKMFGAIFLALTVSVQVQVRLRRCAPGGQQPLTPLRPGCPSSLHRRRHSDSPFHIQKSGRWNGNYPS